MNRTRCLIAGVALAAAHAPAADPPCNCPPRGGLHCPPPVAPPNGSAVRFYQQTQAARAALQKWYVQPHEWFLGGTTLGPAGRRHVARLAEATLACPDKVFVEPVEDDGLNEARRLTVVAELRRYGVTDADTRVGLRIPLGEGLYGDEAASVALQLFRNGAGLGTSGVAGPSAGLGGGNVLGGAGPRVGSFGGRRGF